MALKCYTRNNGFIAGVHGDDNASWKSGENGEEMALALS